jgi:multiple sugar transport system substrate-binding protein
MAQEMLEQFHETHPHMHVFFTPDPPDLRERMLADMQAGTAADVFQGCCTHFPTWAQMGYVLDLRDRVLSELDQTTIDEWDAAQYAALFTREGLQYGLPKYHGALALYYNRDIFDAYGVAYPDNSWDYDAYLDAMMYLTHDRDGDLETDLWGSQLDITWDRIQVHVNGWGGHLVDPDDPELTRMCDAAAMDAQDWLRARMWDDGVMATPLDVRNLAPRDAFVSGQVAMVEDGSWSLLDILAGASFPVGVAPFPAGPAKRVTLATTDGFGVYAGTQHPDEAWELMGFLISEEYGRAMAEAGLLQPARSSLVEEWAALVVQEYPDRIGLEDVAAFAEGQVGGYSVTAEIHARMAEARRAADVAWEEILALGEAPMERMYAACRSLDDGQT